MAQRQLTPDRRPMPSVASPRTVASPPTGPDRGERGERGRAVRVEAEGGAYRLRRWRCAGGPVLACEAEPGSPLPVYAARRRLRERIRPSGAARAVLFTDAARLAGVWSWVEREECGPLAYYERPWDGRDPCSAPARTVRVGRGEAAGGPEVRAGSPSARRATRSALLALLQRGVASVADLHPECADPGQLLQDTIERADDEDELRRIWRAVGRIRILDPCCRCGDWLVGAAEALAQVYLACLERMDVRVADEARRGPARRTRLRDFRAALAAADDPHRWPSRRRYARELAVSRNLRGAGADPSAVAASAARLEEWARGGHAGGPGTPLAPLVLRTGRVAPGAGAARGAGGERGSEEIEAAHRAADLLRRAWLEEGAGETEVAAAARAIRARLSGGDGRVDPWVEWRDVLAAGGFHLVRGGR